MPTKNRVFVSGVWDLFHVGHVRILKRAKKLGYLIVAVNTDRKAESYKRRPVFPEDQRLETIKSIKYVDEAFLLDNMDLKPSVLKYRANIIIHGDDCNRERYLKQTCITGEWLKKNDIRLILLPYTPNVSTTQNFINHGEKYKRLQQEGEH